jgi:hypothetical protein
MHVCWYICILLLLLRILVNTNNQPLGDCLDIQALNAKSTTYDLAPCVKSLPEDGHYF